MATFSPEQIAEIMKRESDKADFEAMKIKFDKKLKNLLTSAEKQGLHLNKKPFAHMLDETDRFQFLGWAMAV